MWQDGTLKHPSGRVFQASLAVKANEIDRQKKRTEKRSSSTKVRYREFHRLLEEIEGVNAERNTHEEGNEKARKFMERELDCTRSTEETDQRLVGIWHHLRQSTKSALSFLSPWLHGGGMCHDSQSAYCLEADEADQSLL
jgi:hypothetical protein